MVILRVTAGKNVTEVQINSISQNFDNLLKGSYGYYESPASVPVVERKSDAITGRIPSGSGTFVPSEIKNQFENGSRDLNGTVYSLGAYWDKDSTKHVGKDTSKPHFNPFIKETTYSNGKIARTELFKVPSTIDHKVVDSLNMKIIDERDIVHSFTFRKNVRVEV